MVATKELIQELISRELCIQCCNINDRFPKRRCSRCARMQYIRQRIKKVEAHLKYYTQELKNLKKSQFQIRKEKYPWTRTLWMR